MIHFIIKLQHDNGFKTIEVVASDEATARAQVQNAEGCPPSAIVKVVSYDPAELDKFGRIGKIKDQIVQLLEVAPELDIDQTFEFIRGLVDRDRKKQVIKVVIPEPQDYIGLPTLIQ